MFEGYKNKKATQNIMLYCEFLKQASKKLQGASANLKVQANQYRFLEPHLKDLKYQDSITELHESLDQALSDT